MTGAMAWPVIVVMGVSGVGKTTVGQALATAIDAAFAEGDHYHPEANVAKMLRGRPLSDDDRWPWLDRLRAEIDAWLLEEKRVVLACSALKASYRERLCPSENAGAVRFVYLQADRDLIAGRLAARKGHYMPASLLNSQLDTLEPPRDAITVDVNRPLDAIVDDLTTFFSPVPDDRPAALPLTKS
ncbi:MAG: gluconokinase [Pseudomonadota bacterium]